MRPDMCELKPEQKETPEISEPVHDRIFGQNSTGIRRIINAATFSLNGLKTAWRTEAAFREELALSAIMIPAGLLIGDSAVEQALLAGTCLIVLITELLNSALETAVDRIGLDQHPLAGRAKDIGSAAVFVSLVLTIMVWGLILYERFHC